MLCLRIRTGELNPRSYLPPTSGVFSQLLKLYSPIFDFWLDAILYVDRQTAGFTCLWSEKPSDFYSG
ncbi:hypothetical protein N7467_006180 [Penicillium canescens]|nr:hypothetical protein N7467_006180 [Penicillium canescens]